MNFTAAKEPAKPEHLTYLGKTTAFDWLEADFGRVDQIESTKVYILDREHSKKKGCYDWA